MRINFCKHKNPNSFKRQGSNTNLKFLFLATALQVQLFLSQWFKE